MISTPDVLMAAIRAGDLDAALPLSDWLEEKGRLEANGLRACYKVLVEHLSKVVDVLRAVQVDCERPGSPIRRYLATFSCRRKMSFEEAIRQHVGFAVSYSRKELSWSIGCFVRDCIKVIQSLKEESGEART